MVTMKALVSRYRRLMKSAHTMENEIKVEGLKRSFENMSVTGEGLLLSWQKYGMYVALITIEVILGMLATMLLARIWPTIDSRKAFGYVTLSIAAVLSWLYVSKWANAIGNAVGKRRIKRMDTWLKTERWWG